MFNLFKKKEIEVYSPIEGELISIEDVDDPVFSKKLLGEGFAVDPKSGVVKSPVDGVVEILHSSHHAVGIKGDNGLEVLVHFGMDTVALNGLGFKPMVQKGDRVKHGQPLLEVDMAIIKDRVPSLKTPVVVTNIDEYEVLKIDLTAKSGQSVMTLKKK